MSLMLTSWWVILVISVQRCEKFEALNVFPKHYLYWAYCNSICAPHQYIIQKKENWTKSLETWSRCVSSQVTWAFVWSTQPVTSYASRTLSRNHTRCRSPTPPAPCLGQRNPGNEFTLCLVNKQIIDPLIESFFITVGTPWVSLPLPLPPFPRSYRPSCSWSCDPP